MYSFLKILIVVVLALVLIDWLAGQQAESWTNTPNAAAGWASLSSNIKIRSAIGLVSGEQFGRRSAALLLLVRGLCGRYLCVLSSAQAICANESLKMLWRNAPSRDASILR